LSGEAAIDKLRTDAKIKPSTAVIPAQAGLSTAELVIHLDRLFWQYSATKWIPAFAGMTNPGAWSGRVFY
jgi:hypothetical protein